MGRIRRRRFVLQRITCPSKRGRIYTLICGRFVFERQLGQPLWRVSDIYSELDFSDLGEKILGSIYATKRAVIKRYLTLEAKRKAERRRKKGILSWREKVVRTRKGDLLAVS